MVSGKEYDTVRNLCLALDGFLADMARSAERIKELEGRIELFETGFPVIKVVGHIVNHMERKDGAIIIEVKATA